MEADKEWKCPTEIPPPVTPRPTEIPRPLVPGSHQGNIELPEGKGTDHEEIPIGMPEYEEIIFDETEYEQIPYDRIQDVKNEMVNPNIRHGTPDSGIPIQPPHVTAMKAVSSRRPVRKLVVILTSTAVFAAVTVASIVGGTIMLSKGKNIEKMKEKKMHSLCKLMII